MAGEASQWVSYDDAAALLGLSAEATKRLALRRGWPRRPGLAEAMEVALPEAATGEMHDDPDGEDDVGSSGTRSLLVYLETHVDRLTEELAEARTEMRGLRYEAESLRIEAARAQVLAALVEAERARAAEIKAERDALAASLAEHRRPWLARTLGMLFDRHSSQRRRSF